MELNVLAALVGYLSAVSIVLIICIVAYHYADRLEDWAKRKFGNKKTK